MKMPWINLRQVDYVELVKVRLGRRWPKIVAALALGGLLATGLLGWRLEPLALAAPSRQELDLRTSLSAAAAKTDALIKRQVTAKRQIWAVADLRDELTRIKVDIGGGRYDDATGKLAGLTKRLAAANDALNRPVVAAATPTPVGAAGVVTTTPAPRPALHVLFYHKTPADFSAQLTHLSQRGYTVATMAQAAAALAGTAALPAKPVVITFDDGFSDQLRAFDMLKARGMPATFYIINGGEQSGWCIGAGRSDHPHGDCGDDYLTWQQIRYLDQSGLITIGGHTANHPCANPSLVTASPSRLRQEIVDSKTEMERQLGHSIYDFSYPCGIYNATVINEVRSAGYLTAVTTVNGAIWYPNSNRTFNINRVRTAWNLP